MKILQKSILIIISFIVITKIQASDDQLSQLPLQAIIINFDYTNLDKLNSMQNLLDSENIDINAQDADGRTALNLAAYYNADPVIIQFLLNHGAQVNLPDRFNQTPLHNAIKNEAIITAEILVNNGADETLKNDNQETPIDLARTDNSKAVFGLSNKGILNE